MGNQAKLKTTLTIQLYLLICCYF